MAEFNQIKVVLVKKKRTGKWLAEQIGKSNCTVSNGVQTQHSLIFLLYLR